MTVNDFRLRRDKILDIIITTYIQTGMPVGSVSVSNMLNFDLSPATIRNVMRELEESGFIVQPHTSAGRVPTDKGYRYYLDNIMEADEITPQEQRDIRSICRPAKGNPQVLLEKAVKALSEFTGLAAVVLFPKLKNNLLKEFKIVFLGGSRAVIIMVTVTGLIKSMDFEYPDKVDGSYLEKISLLINNYCANKPMSQIRDILDSAVLASDDLSYYICRDAIDILKKVEFEEADKLFLDGAHYLLQQPEFRNTDRSKKLFDVFDEKTELMKFIEDSLSLEGVNTYIGIENHCEGIRDCSVVVSNYGMQDSVLGAIGIIGPTRMPYRRVVPLVDCISGEISSIL